MDEAPDGPDLTSAIEISNDDEDFDLSLEHKKSVKVKETAMAESLEFKLAADDTGEEPGPHCCPKPKQEEHCWERWFQPAKGAKVVAKHDVRFIKALGVDKSWELILDVLDDICEMKTSASGSAVRRRGGRFAGPCIQRMSTKPLQLKPTFNAEGGRGGPRGYTRYPFFCKYCNHDFKDKNGLNYHRLMDVCPVYDGSHGSVKMYPIWNQGDQKELERIMKLSRSCLRAISKENQALAKTRQDSWAALAAGNLGKRVAEGGSDSAAKKMRVEKALNPQQKRVVDKADPMKRALGEPARKAAVDVRRTRRGWIRRRTPSL